MVHCVVLTSRSLELESVTQAQDLLLDSPSRNECYSGGVQCIVADLSFRSAFAHSRESIESVGCFVFK